MDIFDIYTDAYQREVYGLDDGDADAILANLAKAGTGAVLDKYLKVDELIDVLPVESVKRWIQAMPENVKQTGSDWFENFLTAIGKESAYMASDALVGDDLTMFEYEVLQDVANGSSPEEARDKYFSQKVGTSVQNATIDELTKRRKKKE